MVVSGRSAATFVSGGVLSRRALRRTANSLMILALAQLLSTAPATVTTTWAEFECGRDVLFHNFTGSCHALISSTMQVTQIMA